MVPSVRSRPAADRSCGACTVCCRVLEIAALAKPAGIACRHNTGAACGVYPTRSPACAQWDCLWLKIPALPNALRPDLSGVLFSLDRHAPETASRAGACIVGRVAGRPPPGQGRSIAEAFAMFVREGSLPVWRVAGRRATRLNPGREDGDPA